MGLILASASPARQELLRSAGIPFRVAPASIREIRSRWRSLGETVLENARRKAAVVARRFPGEWILAADTLISFEGELHGKPTDRAKGIALLCRMSGKTHVLATGLVLRRGQRAIERVVRSRVTIRELSRAQIAKLVQTPQHYAGGYAVLEKDDPLIAKIEGSFSNVVGLPMETVRPLLASCLRS